MLRGREVHAIACKWGPEDDYIPPHLLPLSTPKLHIEMRDSILYGCQPFWKTAWASVENFVWVDSKLL